MDTELAKILAASTSFKDFQISVVKAALLTLERHHLDARLTDASSQLPATSRRYVWLEDEAQQLRAELARLQEEAS